MVESRETPLYCFVLLPAPSFLLCMVGCREIAIKGAPRKQKHLARSLARSVDVLSAGEVGEYLDLTSILPGVTWIVLRRDP